MMDEKWINIDDHLFHEKAGEITFEAWTPSDKDEEQKLKQQIDRLCWHPIFLPDFCILDYDAFRRIICASRRKSRKKKGKYIWLLYKTRSIRKKKKYAKLLGFRIITHGAPKKIFELIMREGGEK